MHNVMAYTCTLYGYYCRYLNICTIKAPWLLLYCMHSDNNQLGLVVIVKGTALQCFAVVADLGEGQNPSSALEITMQIG